MTNPLIAAYEISTGLAGAPALQIHVIYDIASATVTGSGHLTQAINPPLDLKVRLNGSFISPLVQGAPSQFLVFLQGVPLVKWPKYGGIGPELPIVLDVTLTLNADRTEGTAHYAYLDANGKWQELNGVPVKAIPVAPCALK